MTVSIEVTRLINAGGPLTKKLHLTADGALANDSSLCRMSTGRMQRVRLGDWRDFAPLIEATPYNTAWALGALLDCFPDETRLVLKDDLQAGKPGFVARTAENFIYRPNCRAFVLLDYDVKGMPGAAKARIKELGGSAGCARGRLPRVSRAPAISSGARPAPMSSTARQALSTRPQENTFTFPSRTAPTRSVSSTPCMTGHGSPASDGISSARPANCLSDPSSTAWCARPSALSLRPRPTSSRR